MSVRLPAGDTAPVRPAEAVRPAAPVRGHPLGQRIRVPKTAELVAADLRRKIVRGELAEGDALPSEAVLMAEFAVSRPTLRDAFRMLESESLISIRRGARGGARVQVPDGNVAASYAGLVLEYRGTTLQDLYDARTLIEAPCAALLAQRRTEADLGRLRAAVTPRDTAATIAAKAGLSSRKPGGCCAATRSPATASTATASRPDQAREYTPRN